MILFFTLSVYLLEYTAQVSKGGVHHIYYLNQKRSAGSNAIGNKRNSCPAPTGTTYIMGKMETIHAKKK